MTHIRALQDAWARLRAKMTIEVFPLRFHDLERLGRVTPILAIVVYGIGLLVTNAYLFELGVSDFDLLKPRFILTGLVFLLTVAISTTVAFLAIWGIVAAATNKEASIRRRVALCLAPLVVFLAPIAVLTSTFPSPWEGAMWLYFDTLLLGLLFLEATLKPGFLLQTIRGAFSRKPGRQDSATVMYWLVMGIALTYLGFQSVNEFSNRVFPQLPEQLGGGKPRDVSLVFHADRTASLQQLGIPVEDEQSNVAELELLFEGNDFFVLQEKDPPKNIERRVFRVDANAVLAVRSRRDQPR